MEQEGDNDGNPSVSRCEDQVRELSGFTHEDQGQDQHVSRCESHQGESRPTSEGQEPTVSQVRYTKDYQKNQVAQDQKQIADRSLQTSVRPPQEYSVDEGTSGQENPGGSNPQAAQRDEEICRSKVSGNRKRCHSLSEIAEPSTKQSYITLSTDVILDKFLTILDEVKSLNKPHFPCDTNMIPGFDPMSKDQTIVTWLAKVEECAKIYSWGERETIHYALSKLHGAAKIWYQNLPSLMFTWHEWKIKLIKAFPFREDYAELLSEILSKKVKCGESLELYYYAKMNLLNKCKIYGRLAVDCLLHGVEDSAVKAGAQSVKFLEPENVLRYFKEVNAEANTAT